MKIIGKRRRWLARPRVSARVSSVSDLSAMSSTRPDGALIAIALISAGNARRMICTFRLPFGGAADGRRPAPRSTTMLLIARRDLDYSVATRRMSDYERWE